MEGQDKQKTVVLLSGGPDSATLLKWAVAEGYEVAALNLDQGRSHSAKEVEHSIELTDDLGIRLDIMDLGQVVATCGGKVLTVHSEAALLTYGTGIVLSLATAFAIQAQANSVMLAIHADDTDEGPEFSSEFFSAIEHTIHLVGETSFQIMAPFLSIRKPQLLKMGTELGVDYSKTWSCIGIEDQHCGLCGACRARQKAFAEAGLVDPVPYLRTPYYATA